MLDARLAQVVIVAAAFVVLTVGIIASITILRRRRMANHDMKAVLPTATTPLLSNAPAPTSKIPAPIEAPAAAPENPIVQPIALDPPEPDSFTIEPDKGPTERERDVHRLIAYLKSDNDMPDEPPTP